MSLLNKPRKRKPKLTTLAAFKELLYDPVFSNKQKETVAGKRYLYQTRMRFKQGKDLTNAKMEELLEKNGYKVAKEKLWKK